MHMGGGEDRSARDAVVADGRNAEGLGIIGSLARLVKANDPESPLSDLDVQLVGGIGAAQTATSGAPSSTSTATTRRAPDGRAAIDAYLTLIAPAPQRIPDDAVFVHVLSEAEVVGTLNPRMMTEDEDRDTPVASGYEIAGSSHMLRSEQYPGMDRAAHPAEHTDEPFDMLLRAIADNLVVALATVRRCRRAADHRDPHARRRRTRRARERDRRARAPWVEVPTAQYLPRCSCSPTTGEKIPFSGDEVARLYGGAGALRAARSRSVDSLKSNADSSSPPTPVPWAPANWAKE